MDTHGYTMGNHSWSSSFITVNKWTILAKLEMFRGTFGVT